MSRCSPFPPSRYVWKGVCGEALLELTIQVKREWAATEKRRKKERRQRKKEDRREKRRIRKKEQSSDERHWGFWNTIDWKRSDHPKKRKYEPKMVNFCLIEEMEQHIVSEVLGHSFYNSEDINRRKPCSFACRCHEPHGNIIWTENLPQKITDQEVESTPNKIGKLETDATPSKVRIFHISGFSKAVSRMLDPRLSWMPCCAAYKRATNEGATGTAPITRIPETDSQETESQFRELLENWFPIPQLSELTEFDEQEWLFETRPVRKITSHGLNHMHEDLHHGSSTLYPQGRYLPEADLLALPFTVIF